MRRGGSRCEDACISCAGRLATIIPSLLNPMIGGFSLLRGIPLVTVWLLRKMPDHNVRSLTGHPASGCWA